MSTRRRATGIYLGYSLNLIHTTRVRSILWFPPIACPVGPGHDLTVTASAPQLSPLTWTLPGTRRSAPLPDPAASSHTPPRHHLGRPIRLGCRSPRSQPSTRIPSPSCTPPRCRLPRRGPVNRTRPPGINSATDAAGGGVCPKITSLPHANRSASSLHTHARTPTLPCLASDDTGIRPLPADAPQQPFSSPARGCSPSLLVPAPRRERKAASFGGRVGVPQAQPGGRFGCSCKRKAIRRGARESAITAGLLLEALNSASCWDSTRFRLDSRLSLPHWAPQRAFIYRIGGGLLLAVRGCGWVENLSPCS